MIKLILVPIDGSDHSNKALELAADLAEKYEAKLIILHALLRFAQIDQIESLCLDLSAPRSILQKLESTKNDIYAESSVDAMLLPLLPEEILRDVGELIIEKAKQTLKSKGLKDFTTHILNGDPADCILMAVDYDNPDMIVMGNRGLGKVSSLLLGSVSSKVNHLASCTCITVK